MIVGGGCANPEPVSQHSGSYYHLSISSFKEPGAMTWTIQGASEGMGPHFDVSNRVREGAGGEGQARAAGSSLLSQPGFHSDTSLPSSPLSSLPALGPCLHPSLWAALGSWSHSSSPCPNCGPIITCAHTLPGWGVRKWEGGRRWAGDEAGSPWGGGQTRLILRGMW